MGWHGYPERDFSVLAGRFGLAAALAPAPEAARQAVSGIPVPGTRLGVQTGIKQDVLTVPA
jgi:hypothetical protein